MNRAQRKYAALFGSIFVVFAALYFAIIFPSANAARSAKAETVVLTLKLDGYHKSLDMVHAYLQRRDSLAQRSAELTARLYARDDVLALIERLKTRATEFNANVREISPSVVELLAINNRPPQESAPQHVNISLRVSADSDAAGTLLQALESEPFFVDLLSLHVVGRERGLAPAEYVFNFRAQLGSLPVSERATR